MKKFIISFPTLSFRESGSVNATRQRDSRFVRDSPDGRAPAAQEDNLVIFQLHARQPFRLLRGGDEARKNHRASPAPVNRCLDDEDHHSPLYVIIEHPVLVLISLKEVEGRFGLEVLVLDSDLREDGRGSGHEGVHEVGRLSSSATRYHLASYS